MSVPFTVLVFGSRDFTNREVIHYDLAGLAATVTTRFVVVNGYAPGVDRIADDWAVNNGHGYWRFPADWPTCDPGHPKVPCPGDRGRHRKVNRRGAEFCPLAGHRRNQSMADLGPEGIDIALGYLSKPLRRSTGTADMARRLLAAGIEPVIYGGDQLSLHRPGLVQP